MDYCWSTGKTWGNGQATTAQTPARQALDHAITERTMLEEITRAAHIGGWLFMHQWRSDHSPSGWPDMVCLRIGPRAELLLLELKTARGVVSPDQHRWLEAWQAFFEAHGLGVEYAQARVVRPADMPDVLELLVRR